MENASGVRRTLAKAADNAAARSTIMHNDTSLKKLVMFFCGWKSVLLIIAAASPGPGYDTSTQLLLYRAGPSSESSFAHVVEYVVPRLTRWDAIYFASCSERGQLFEQEWAFSGTLARLTSGLARVFPLNSCSSSITCHALAGIVISHISHLLAVLFLFKLTYEAIPSSPDRKRQIAFTAACLHVLSPAGLFLSAPYGESTFAAAHFAGVLCYILARKHDTAPDSSGVGSSSILTILSGILVGFSAMIRSNGLLSGSIFAWDAILCIPQLPGIVSQLHWNKAIRLTSTLLGGLFIGIGYILPQIEAYKEYCTLGNSRPWCTEMLPSIYTFVQSHYWNVGFLHYWTLSNLPLFALAAPMLVLLSATAFEALRHCARGKVTTETQLYTTLMARLALPQLILTFLAITNFHVQIINRISSGYPAWYIVLAIAMHGNDEANCSRIMKVLRRKSEWIARAAILYAIVQGGLYASFMPPA